MERFLEREIDERVWLFGSSEAKLLTRLSTLPASLVTANRS